MKHKLPATIEALCQRMERGVPAWKLALEYDVPTPMIYHFYHWHRGYLFSARKGTP